MPDMTCKFQGFTCKNTTAFQNTQPCYTSPYTGALCIPIPVQGCVGQSLEMETNTRPWWLLGRFLGFISVVLKMSENQSWYISKVLDFTKIQTTAYKTASSLLVLSSHSSQLQNS